MDDSELSFFNQSEFNFDDGYSMNSAAENVKQNRLHLSLIGKDVYKENNLVGSILLDVKSSIKKGRFIMFFETVE